MSLLFMLGVAIVGYSVNSMIFFLLLGSFALVVVGFSRLYNQPQESKVDLRASEFKKHIEVINTFTSDKDYQFIKSFEEAWRIWRTRNEYQELFNAVAQKAPYAVHFLQDSWDKYKDPKVPRPLLPRYILSS